MGLRSAPKVLTAVLALAASWAVFCPSSAVAAPISVNFSFNTTCGAASSTCGPLDGSDGNIRFFTGSDSATTVQARAWSFTGNGTTNNTAETAWLGQWIDNSSPFDCCGLGVTNRDSVGSSISGTGANGGDGPGESNQHTMDNVGRLDFITFLFNRKVNLLHFVLDAYAEGALGPDSDFQVIVGNLTDGPDAGTAINDGDVYSAINGKMLSQISLLGTNPCPTQTSVCYPSGNSGDRTAIFNPLPTGNFIVLMANPSGTNDMMKISAMKVKVPEPGTLFLLLAGLLGLVSLRFGRKRAAALIAS